MSTIFTMNSNAYRSLSHSMYAQITDWRNGPVAKGSTPKVPKYEGLSGPTAAFRRICAQPVYAMVFVVGVVELIVRGFFGVLSWAMHACLPEGEFKQGFYNWVVEPLLDGAILSGATGVIFGVGGFFYNLQSNVI